MDGPPALDTPGCDHVTIILPGKISENSLTLLIDNSNNRERTCGFHLTRSKWDPYPWVSAVDSNSAAEAAGLRAGDCLIRIDDVNLMGLRMQEVANLMRSHDRGSEISLEIYRCSCLLAATTTTEEKTSCLDGPLPQVAKKLANGLGALVRSLECPVCLESATPPVSQCVHGHILCVSCRAKTPRCPVCRVRLGQGRCLLADKCHRILQDTLDDSPTADFGERLFGKREKKREEAAPVKPRQMLLARLFRDKKAASTENLSRTGTRASYRFDFDGISDRTKSASVGELAVQTDERGLPKINNCKGLLSPPQTPTWAGSSDSVTSTAILCPLTLTSGCKDLVPYGAIVEHFNVAHVQPIVNFYSDCAVLPFPLPFGPQAAYLMHHLGTLFFIQYKDEALWISSSGTLDRWDWVLYAKGSAGTEIKLQRTVSRAEEPFLLFPEHLAPLPRALEIYTIDIKLELRSQEEGTEL